MTEKLPPVGSAADVMAALDSDLKPVEVPEWKCTVYVRVLSAGDAMALGEAVAKLGEDVKGVHSIYLNVAACLVDAKGVRLFTPEECIEKLATRNQKVLVRLHEIANAHNKVDSAETVKNGSSEAAAPAVSPTA